jgi:hypothetical protein
MKLQIEWLRPISLNDAADPNLIYAVEIERLPPAPGIYIFGRLWGNQFEALYVGKASRVRGRIKKQLNNLKLMHHLKNAKNGKRVVLAGRIITKPGQQVDKCLPIIERALIRYFLSEGHDLVNKQGTSLRRHELESLGKYPKQSLPDLIYIEKEKGE